MIEDLLEVENHCNQIGLIIDPGIKNMYETLCNDQKFSALSEIHLNITRNWNKINSYYDSYPTVSPSIMQINNYIANYGGYHYNYNYVCEHIYTYCIYFLHHTTLIPIYKIEIKTNYNNLIDEEVYDIHTYRKPKERNVWDYNGAWNNIQITYSDKNNLKEIIQQKFELLMQDD